MARSTTRSRSRTSSRRKGNTVSVNMKGVEGKRALAKEGKHLAKVIEATQEEGDKGPYISWTLEVVGGKSDGAPLYNNTSLTKKSLWNLKAWLEALDVEVPDDEMDIDLDDMPDREIGVMVEHETYDGKPQARIVDFWPPDGEEEKEEEEERGSRRRRGRDDKEDEEEETRSSRRRRGRDKEDDEEEERGSRRSGGRSSRKKEKVKREDVEEMSQDELEDVIKDNDLDVKLEKHRTLSRMRNVVLDALEAADKLED